jgi:hypothetical protein
MLPIFSAISHFCVETYMNVVSILLLLFPVLTLASNRMNESIFLIYPFFNSFRYNRSLAIFHLYDLKTLIQS